MEEGEENEEEEEKEKGKEEEVKGNVEKEKDRRRRRRRNGKMMRGADFIYKQEEFRKGKKLTMLLCRRRLWRGLQSRMLQATDRR